METEQTGIKQILQDNKKYGKIPLKVAGNRTIWADITEYPLAKIRLDPENPRFAHEKKTYTDKELEDKIWDENDTRELYRSIIASRGLSEAIFIKRDGRVREGNRRVVCFRRAQKDLQKGLLKGNIPPGTFDSIPVIILPDETPSMDIDLLLARWHVSGKKEWDAINQGEHIHKLYDTHSMTFDEVAEHLGKSKGWIYQKWWAYRWTIDFLEKKQSGDIYKFSFFDELYRKKEFRAKFETDESFRNDFYDWILSNKFDKTGSKDVRLLPDIMADNEVYSTFVKKGIKAAEVMLADKSPEYGSRTFRIINNTIEALRQMPREEYYGIPQNPAQLTALKELHNELNKIFKELNIK